jgi:hypothetical protein
MNTKDKLELLRERFIQRTDAFAYQWYSKSKQRGGYMTAVTGICEYGCPKRVCEHVSLAELTDEHLIKHLRGEHTIGVYQLLNDKVTWMCFDVDADTEEGEEHIQEHTKKVASVVYKLIGPRFLVEWSGGRGYHVWVFFSEPVEASAAMTFGHYVVSRIQEQDGVHIEIYPKQEIALNLGNLIKLPLGVHQKTRNRCFFVNNRFDSYPKEEQFSRLESVTPLTRDELYAIIDSRGMKVFAPKPRTENSAVGWTTPPCMARLMAEGSSEGSRDTTTFRLACYLRDRGLPEQITRAALDEWNYSRNNPPLDDRQLESKIDSAYSGTYSPFPCNQPEFDSYCSSSCRLWQNKVEGRWIRLGRKESEAIGKISRD